MLKELDTENIVQSKFDFKVIEHDLEEYQGTSE
jgi:hypothetical protein